MPRPRVLFADQAAKALKRGFDQMAELLAVTLGPTQGSILSERDAGAPELLASLAARPGVALGTAMACAALASDVVIAASDVRFRQLEIARGIMLRGTGLAHLWQETLVLSVMLSVLVASCPCALSLAVPTALAAAHGALAPSVAPVVPGACDQRLPHPCRRGRAAGRLPVVPAVAGGDAGDLPAGACHPARQCAGRAVVVVDSCAVVVVDSCSVVVVEPWQVGQWLNTRLPSSFTLSEALSIFTSCRN